MEKLSLTLIPVTPLCHGHVSDFSVNLFLTVLFLEMVRMPEGVTSDVDVCCSCHLQANHLVACVQITIKLPTGGLRLSTRRGGPPPPHPISLKMAIFMPIPLRQEDTPA